MKPKKLNSGQLLRFAAQTITMVPTIDVIPLMGPSGAVTTQQKTL